MSEKISFVDLEKRFGARVNETVKAEANTLPQLGFVRLPPGITNGIAHLRECYLGKNEKGMFWRAMGVVVSPDYVGYNGSQLPVRNLPTSIVIQFTDDGIKDELKRVMDHMKGLCGNSVFASASVSGKIDMERLCEAVVRAAPYFRFSTSQSAPSPEYPNPRVWENWHGKIDGYVPTASKPAVTVVSPPPVSTSPSSATDSAIASALNPAPWSEATPTEQTGYASPGETSTQVEYRDDEDLDSLAVRATNKDTNAEEKLTGMAKQLGYSQDDVDESPSWTAVVEWIKSGKKKGESEEPKDEKPKRTISVGSVHTYEPPNAKDATKRLKSRDCKVIAADSDKRIAMLENLAKKSEKFEVSWDDEFLK